jgi:signal transduction histidine kinase
MFQLPAGLLELHKALLLEEITAILRHDLRNRHAAVLNATFFLRRKVQVGADALWSGDKRVPQMFALIDDELRAAEALMASRLPVEAAPVAQLDDAVRRLLDGQGPTLALEAPPARLRARVSEAELQVAVAALVENALEAGGAVSVRCHADGGPTVEVVDDGPGFVADAAARAREPGFSTKPGRMGMGLNIAARVAARAGGKLEVAARAPSGVRVALILRGVDG